jgi:hypothetical protein
LIRNIDARKDCATLDLTCSINGEYYSPHTYNHWFSLTGHTYLHHLDIGNYYNKFGSELEKALSKNEWIHMELKLDIMFEEKRNSLCAKFGIHVLKEENNLEDIKFTNPYRKRKSDEYLSAMVFKYGRGCGFNYCQDCCDDCSGCCREKSCLGSMWAWQNYSPNCRCKPYFKTMPCTLSQFHPLPKKQRIVDIEVFETELRHKQRMGLLSLIPSGLERVASLLGHLKTRTVSCSIGFLFLFACFFSCFAGFLIFFSFSKL